MEPKWLALASELLELASSEFSNHGCNDWKWPKDWTRPERLAFAEQMVRDNVRKPTAELTPDEKEQVTDLATGSHGPPDWWVMAFLAGRLSNQR